MKVKKQKTHTAFCTAHEKTDLHVSCAEGGIFNQPTLPKLMKLFVDRMPSRSEFVEAYIKMSTSKHGRYIRKKRANRCWNKLKKMNVM